jgi:uncharacterized protein YjiS (DUF1127 family)
MELLMTFEPRHFELLALQSVAYTDSTPPRFFLRTCAVRAGAWLSTVIEQRRQRRTLRQLDDRQLADIGLTRSDVSSETAKWPWQL